MGLDSSTDPGGDQVGHRKRIVVVSAGLSVPSSTRLLAEMLGEATVKAVQARGEEAELRVIELRTLAHQLADNLLTGFGGKELTDAIEAVHRADGVIAVTPVFSASYSGLFKTFFDVMEPGLLDGKPIVAAATAGTARHSLVIEHALRPLFAYLHAVVVPTGVFAATDDFGAAGDGQLQQRVDRAANELAALVTVTCTSATATGRKLVNEEFASPTSFEDLLKRASDGPAAY